MPHVINGCGTWYYGKNRIHVIPGRCGQCGQLSELTSYDTTKYFTLLFVPIVPLSKWRVLEECKICHKHRALGLKEWEAAKARDSAEVTAGLRRTPTTRTTSSRRSRSRPAIRMRSCSCRSPNISPVR